MVPGYLGVPENLVDICTNDATLWMKTVASNEATIDTAFFTTLCWQEGRKMDSFI